MFVCLFLAALGLHCCTWAFPSCSERKLLFVVVHGLLIAVASLVAEQGSRHAGFSSCGTWAQHLWLTGLVAPQHVGSSRTRDWTHVPCIGRRILNHWATREVPQNTTFLVVKIKETYFLAVLEGRSPRSKCQQVLFLLRPLSLACRWPPSYYGLTWSLLCACVSLVSLCVSKFPPFMWTPVRLDGGQP